MEKSQENATAYASVLKVAFVSVLKPSSERLITSIHVTSSHLTLNNKSDANMDLIYYLWCISGHQMHQVQGG